MDVTDHWILALHLHLRKLRPTGNKGIAEGHKNFLDLIYISLHSKTVAENHGGDPMKVST